MDTQKKKKMTAGAVNPLLGNELLQESATFSDKKALKGLQERFSKSLAVRYLAYARAAKDPLRFISKPGVGKSSLVTQYYRSQGLKVVLLHLPTYDPDRSVVAVPVTLDDGSRILDQVIWSDLIEADVVILDELSRAKPATSNMVMEMVQEKTLGGHAMKEGVTFVALDNHQGMSGVVSSQDLAQASRWTTVELDRRDTPWQLALAQVFKDTDLSKVFDLYNNLEAKYPGVLDYLEPRTLEHVIWNVLQGHPAIWGIPLMAGPRAGLMSADRGKDNLRDVTEEVLRQICAALGRPYLANVPDAASKAIRAALTHGKTLMLQGEPGIGKTAFVEHQVAQSGMRHVYWNLPNIRPDRHVIPFPEGEDRLSLWISEQLNPRDKQPYVMIADEYWRAKPSTSNIMLEVTQGGTIGGMKVPLHTVIAMTNPRETAGVRQNVGRPDRAMADRFFMSVDLTPEDIPANDWMIEKYGDVAMPFLEWYKEDLDDTARVYISKRVIERMIKSFSFFEDLDHLDNARPMLGNKHVPVGLHDLKTRLRNRPVARLSRVVANEDEYIARLAERAVGGAADQAAHIEVAEALAKAEITELKKHREALVRIMAHLDNQHLTSLTLSRSGEARSVVSDIILEAFAAKAKK